MQAQFHLVRLHNNAHQFPSVSNSAEDEERSKGVGCLARLSNTATTFDLSSREKCEGCSAIMRMTLPCNPTAWEPDTSVCAAAPRLPACTQTSTLIFVTHDDAQGKKSEKHNVYYSILYQQLSPYLTRSAEHLLLTFNSELKANVPLIRVIPGRTATWNILLQRLGSSHGKAESTVM